MTECGVVWEKLGLKNVTVEIRGGF